MKDSEFIRSKVPMTKEAVRAISIDKLQLKEAQRLLDIGAGTGSISIQSACQYPNLEVVAIEQKPEAVALIHENIDHFGLDNIQVLSGKAPLLTSQLKAASFDAIFVGGSGGNMQEILDWSWTLLKTDGRLVLNFILLENALEAIEGLDETKWQALDVSQHQNSEWVALGKGHYFKPQNPTIIINTQKKEQK